MILNDFDDFNVCDVTPNILLKSIKLLEQHQLRALDAIQLACAVEIKVDIFISADKKQIAAAKKSKLKTIVV